MVAANTEQLRELSHKLWTFAPVETRAYSFCIWVENAHSSLLADDRNVSDVENDWFTFFDVGICPDDQQTFERFRNELPIRCLIMLQAIIRFAWQVEELREMHRWATAQALSVYPVARQAVAAAIGTGEHTDFSGPAARLGLYVLRSQDMNVFSDTSVLMIEDEPFADNWLSKIGTLTHLQELSLRGCSPVGSHLSSLRTLKALKILELSDTDIGNPDLRDLAEMPSLSRLVLRNTDVNGGIVVHLREIASLREVFLPKRQFDTEAIASMKSSLPYCWFFAD